MTTENHDRKWVTKCENCECPLAVHATDKAPPATCSDYCTRKLADRDAAK